MPTNQNPRFGSTVPNPEESAKYRVTVSISVVERGKDGERVVNEVLKVSASENEISEALSKTIRILDLQNPS